MAAHYKAIMTTNNSLTLEAFQAKISEIQDEIKLSIVGQEEVIKHVPVRR